MLEEGIKYMEIPDLLKQENVYAIQAEPTEIREQLKALYFARLAELKAENAEAGSQPDRVFSCQLLQVLLPAHCRNGRRQCDA